MRFYMIALSAYSVAATVLLVLLAMENKKLKVSDQNLDLKTVYEINLTNAPSKGPENAPITLVEYSDFECSFCAKSSRTIEDLIDAYPGQIRRVFKHYPLTIHKNAVPAIYAAMAAHAQGKFWEMKTLLFENQGRLGEPTFFMEAAQELGLETEEFAADNQAELWQAYVDENIKEANTLGVTGTPTFFVNGIKIRGINSRHLKEAVEHVLAK